MTLITRLGRLFKADMHAVIDQLEEPYTLLRQAIREMEAALTDDERALKQARHRYREMGDSVDQLSAGLNRIATELDICFAANNDELARALIKRKLEQQQWLAILGSKRKQLAEHIDNLQQRLDQRRPTLESLRQKAELFAEDVHKQSTDIVCSATSQCYVSRDDVEVELLREKQQRNPQ